MKLEQRGALTRLTISNHEREVLRMALDAFVQDGRLVLADIPAEHPMHVHYAAQNKTALAMHDELKQ